MVTNNDPSVYEFPHKETRDLRIWSHLDIDQKGKLNVNPGEQIHESIIYKFKKEEDLLRILSKIDKNKSQVTYVISSKNILSKPIKTTIEAYNEIVKDLEIELSPILEINSKHKLTGEQIEKQIKSIF